MHSREHQEADTVLQGAAGFPETLYKWWDSNQQETLLTTEVSRKQPDMG